MLSIPRERAPVTGTDADTRSARPVRDPARDASANDDARVCARIVRRHARTFALASWLLPAGKRRATYALYAFCRVADDAADELAPIDRRAAAHRIGALGRDLDAALAGAPADPIMREVARAVDRFAVPGRLLRELLAGVARDLDPTRFATWEDLARYCAGVASSVGAMCAHVFGVAGGRAEMRRALGHARTLGVAMQLTNILRDVGEDRARGRCYLPDEDLARFGLTRDDVLRDPDLARRPGWSALARFEIERARALYADAAPGIALLTPDARRCATACAAGYAAILDAIERLDHDTISTRARVARWRRGRILLGAVLGVGAPRRRAPVASLGLPADASPGTAPQRGPDGLTLA